MIDVGVGKDDCIEVFCGEGERSIFLGCVLSLALKHSTIQGNGPSIHMEQVTRACNFSCRADKRYFQISAFCDCITLKEDDEPLAVLGHERRFPSPSASLVEQIGERILVFSRMTRELDHDSLIFFHRELD
jgi:hypothetical protein